MELKEFSNIINSQLIKLKIETNKEMLSKLFKFMNLLIEWNQKMNLTAIKDEKEIIQKHFVDSLTILKKIQGEDMVIDVGTGAGFPGIPLKIANEKIKITLVDSLKKRTIFLETVVKELELKNVSIIHSRAEDLSKNEEHREKYNVVVSRAVANTSVLAEYMLPFAIITGKAVCMKGPNCLEEIEESKEIITKLGGKIERIEEIILPESDMRRNIIEIIKVNNTPKQFSKKNNR